MIHHNIISVLQSYTCTSPGDLFGVRVVFKEKNPGERDPFISTGEKKRPHKGRDSKRVMKL